MILCYFQINLLICLNILALRVFDTKHADDIHKSLMVDHISSVSPWMVAVKQLIFHYNAKSELLKIDDESS